MSETHLSSENMSVTPPIILVSACLVGIACRYDGESINSPECLEELDRRNAIWIPFCPEQLGGLPTPRTAANIINGDGEDVLNGTSTVTTRTGIDVTEQFLHGARQVLEIARQQKTEAVFLKARSPSCAVNDRIGVTAALLARNGYRLQEF